MKALTTAFYFTLCLCTATFAQSDEYANPANRNTPYPQSYAHQEPANNQCEFSEKDSSRWKESVASVIIPQFRKYTTGSGKHHVTHYISRIAYTINGERMEREIQDSYLYWETQNADEFVLLYDSTNTARIHVLDYKPVLDPLYATDTTTGTIQKIYAPGDEITFSYFVNGVKRMKEQVLDIGQSLYTQRPDIVLNRRFLVRYEKEDPAKAIIFENQPLDTATYRFRPHNNIIGLNTMPLANLKLTYEYIFAPHFLITASASLHYDPLHMAAYSARSGNKRGVNDYTDKYYNFKNTSTYAIGVKWYCARDKAPQGFYTSLQGAFFSGDIQSDYVNKTGLERDSTTIFFTSQSAENKAKTLYSTVHAFGGRTGVGYCFFLDNSYHWMLDAGIGFVYYFMPSSVKENKVIDGTTYYYHDTPVWDAFLNLPVYTDVSLCYKF